MYKQLKRLKELNRPIRTGKYVRCSSDEQKKHGYTIGDQLAYLDDFCVENELVSVGEYVDEGISATLEINKRKALAQLINDAKAGKIDLIIFKCIDRFFRNVGEYYECQKQLQKAGVTWISVEENDLDPDDDDASFKINIYLALAEYEAKKVSKRIKFNNKNRIKAKQVVMGQQCFHFPWIVVGEQKNRHLEKNMEKADMLYDILHHLETYQSKRKTVTYINKHYDFPMSMSSFTSLVTSTLLYGEYKGIENYVEPYITKEHFDRIQEQLKRNARYSPAQEERVFLFTGIVTCPHCGRKLAGNYMKSRAVHKEGTDTYYYRCNKYRVQRTCDFNISVCEKKIEKQLLDNLEQYIENEIVNVESIVEKKKPKTDNSKRIDAIKNEMDRLTRIYRKGRIEEEEYDTEFLMLERELKTLDVEEKPVVRDLSTLKDLLGTDYRSLYNELDKAHKKSFWRKLIAEFSIDENRKVDPKSIIFFN